jgi:hypothetical protein
MNTIDPDAALRSVDPAASLPPLSPARFERLKDYAMTETTPAAVIAKKPTTRNRITWSIASALAVATIVAFAVASTPSATPATPLAAGPEGIAAKCLETTPESLAELASVAFEATATSIDGDVVTLTVTNRFTGEITDTVTTTQGDGLVSDGGPLVYEEGASYLIASDGERIFSCGQSAETNDYLLAVYEAAFN